MESMDRLHFTIMLSSFVSLCLVLGVLGAAWPDNMTPCESEGLGNLPPVLVLKISFHITDRGSIARLILTSRYFHHLLQPLLEPLRLFHHSVYGAALAHHVPAYLNHIRGHRDHSIHDMSHAEALGLYDRLLDCEELLDAEKVEILNVLMDQVAVFGDVIIGADLRKCPRQFVAGACPQWSQPPSVSCHENMMEAVDKVHHILEQTPNLADHGIPDHVVREIRELVASAFPHNVSSTNRLLQLLRMSSPDLLKSYNVLLDLLSHGIRFDFTEFIRRVQPSPELLPQLYPLLRKPSLDGRSGFLHAISELCRNLLVNDHRCDLAIAFVQIPQVRDAILSQKNLFADLLHKVMRCAPWLSDSVVEFLEFICAQPYASDLINGFGGDTPLLHTAFENGRFLNVLLRVPGLDLDCRDRHFGRPAVACFFEHGVRLNLLLQRVPADKFADLIRANPDSLFAYMEQSALKSDNQNVKLLLESGVLTDIINHRYGHDKHTILHWAAKAAVPGILASVMQVRNLDVAVQDNSGHTAFYYVTYRNLRMIGFGFILSQMAYTDRERFVTVTCHLLQERNPELLRYMVASEVPRSLFARCTAGCDFLHVAFQKNDFLLVSQLLTLPSIVIDCRNQDGRVPFSCGTSFPVFKFRW